MESTDGEFLASTGVAGNNPTSEFVRQELRAVVGARTAQAQPATSQRSLSTAAQQLQQQLGQADLESLGITFEMPSGKYCRFSPFWDTIGCI